MTYHKARRYGGQTVWSFAGQGKDFSFYSVQVRRPSE